MVPSYAAMLLLILLLFEVAVAAPGSQGCDCKAAWQIVANQRQEIAHLQTEVHRLRAGAEPAARRTDATLSGCSRDWDVTSDEDLRELEGCRAVGDLTISHTDVTSLVSLSTLETASNILIGNSSILTNLTGLQSLESAESLVIEKNDGLTSLEGVEKLVRVGRLEVGWNQELTSLTGLQRLESADRVAIFHNSQLESLTGLEKLARVGELDLSHNTKLGSLAALQSLDTAESVSVEDAGTLESMTGLEKLRRVGKLNVSSNRRLGNLTGLENLEAAEHVSIINCGVQSLAGLGKLARVGTLLVDSNPLMTLEGLESLATAEEVILVGNHNLISTVGLGNLRRVEGRLLVEPFVHRTPDGTLFFGNFRSLAGLENLTRVGKLELRYLGLSTLDGLRSLDTVQEVRIEGTDLESLSGLEKLTRLEKLELRGVHQLSTLDGLGNLETAQEVHIEGTSLESLSGLEKLAHVGQLRVIRGWSLRSLAGLENLETAQEIHIQDTGLHSLSSLEKLAHVGQLRVIGNFHFRTFDLPRLETAEVGIEVRGNNHHDAFGLGTLKRVGVLDVSDGYWLNYITHEFPNLEVAEAIMIYDCWQLESLPNFKKLVHLGTLRVARNDNLQSLFNFPSLEAASFVDISSNARLSTLAGLDNLRRAQRVVVSGNAKLTSLAMRSLESAMEVHIQDSNSLGSLPGLEGLAQVGWLSLDSLPALTSLAELGNLTLAWSGVSITSCPQLRTLGGLRALRRSGAIVVTNSPVKYLGVLGIPLAEGMSIGVLRFDEASWPRCVSQHERTALLLAVEDLEKSTIPNVTTWNSSDCGKDFGTFSCTKGQPCNLSLAGKGSSDNGVSVIFVTSRFTGCGPCPPEHHHVQRNVTEGGAVDLGCALRDEEAGLHSVCHCANEVKPPLAQLLLRGPRPGNVTTTCSRGRRCSFWVDGEGLERTDHVVLMSSCSGDPHAGFPASWSAGSTYILEYPAWYAALPAFYQVCWRAPFASAPDDLTCPAPEDSYFPVGEVQLFGAYRRTHRPTLGEEFSVPNIGLGVSDGDRMRLKRACGEAGDGEETDVLATVSSGMVFDFGRLTEDRAQGGRHELCWCQEREGAPCNEDSHFVADAGVVQILCPAGQGLVGGSRCQMCPAGKRRGPEPGLEPCGDCPPGQFSLGGRQGCEACPEGAVARVAGSSICVPCEAAWHSATAEADDCTVDPLRLALLVSFSLFVGASGAMLAYGIRRRLSVVDVSLDKDHTIVTTLGSHGLRNFGRRSFPVTLHGTGHPGLDSPSSPLWARAKDAVRLELLTQAGKPIDRRLDTSMGTLTVTFPHDFLHQAWPVPTIVGLPLLFVVDVALLILLLWTGMAAEALPAAAAVGLACAAATAALRRRRRATPLEQRLSQFSLQKLAVSPSQSCQKGPNRAIAAGKLHELLQLFDYFIRDRTAYYLDQNVIQPLTKPKQLSYAELVGAKRVEWFVSHFWGTPFQHFCAAVRKHAEVFCGQRDWTSLTYWICFCSNNQHHIQDELGAGWEESSFYLTLKSGHCRGTCMILDDEALPLTRIWCIFELLQTIKLERASAAFEGLFLCTSGGVLNTGGGSAEVAMALAEKVADLNLGTAEATSADDAFMIRKQVMEEMGSFGAMNGFICREVRGMLVRAQQSANQHFDAVLTHLDVAIRNNPAANTASL